MARVKHVNELSAIVAEKSKHFGHVKGVPVGTKFESRQKCYEAGVHASLQAGIVGNTKEGAYSVVLSKGYVDDKDEGNVVYYTGSGGRDTKKLKNEDWLPPQTFDQQFVRQNLALKISQETQNPIRLVRGCEGNTIWSPVDGYRYDGLYRVVEAWRELGSSKFMICKYKFVREPNQPPIPTQSIRILSRNKTAAKSKKVTAPPKVDTSRAGIRVREREEEREEERLRQEQKLADQAARMKLKRNASILSDTEETSRRVHPPKRLMSGPRQLAKRTPQSPVASSSTSPFFTSGHPTPRILQKTPPEASIRSSLGKIKTQGIKRVRDDSTSPITPEDQPTSPPSFVQDSDIEFFEGPRKRKRIMPSISESLQEKMQRLCLPESSPAKRFRGQ